MCLEKITSRENPAHPGLHPGVEIPYLPTVGNIFRRINHYTNSVTICYHTQLYVAIYTDM